MVSKKKRSVFQSRDKIVTYRSKKSKLSIEILNIIDYEIFHYSYTIDIEAFTEYTEYFQITYKIENTWNKIKFLKNIYSCKLYRDGDLIWDVKNQ